MPLFRMIEEEPLYDIRRLTYAHGVRDACPRPRPAPATLIASAMPLT
jgi:hypothetical protein